MRRYEQYRVRDDTVIDVDFFNGRFGDIDARLASTEEGLSDIEARAEETIQRIRDRGSAAIGEFVGGITGLAEVGALSTIAAGGPVDVGTGPRTVTVWPAYRGRIIRPAYVMLTSTSDVGASIGGAITAYDAVTGALTINVIHARGTGLHTDWRGGISAATSFYPEHQVDGLRIRFRQSDGQWGAWITVAAASTIDSIVGLAQTLASKADGAAVANALAEMVSRNELIGLLLAKADTAHGHAIGAITGLQNALDAKAPTNHAHDTSSINGLVEMLGTKAAASAVDVPAMPAKAAPIATDLVAAWDTQDPNVPRKKLTLRQIAASAEASAADIWAGTARDLNVTPKALADAAAFRESSGAGAWEPDLSTGINFRRTATGQSTLAAPVNGIPGWTYIFVLNHGSQGGRWAVAPAFDFGSGGTADFSTQPGKEDIVVAVCIAAGRFTATFHGAS